MRGKWKISENWQSHWLPWKHPSLVSSPMIASLEEANIDMLIDVDTRQWNPDLADGIFAPEESALIKKSHRKGAKLKTHCFGH